MAFQQFNVSPWLTPVRLAATSNQSGTYFNGQVNNGVGATLTYATGALTIDSVTVEVGDRVILTAQTNANENGVYVCNVAGATGVAAILQRSADQQCIEQMKAGQYVSVAAGSVEAGNFYTLVEPLPAHLGIDDLDFNADPSAGAVSFSGGASTANALPVFSDTAGNIKAATTTVTLGQALSITGALTASGAIASTAGNITSGSSGDAGNFISFPATAANGTFIFEALNAGGAFNTTVRNSVMGQSSVISIPDPGTATSKFVLQDGNNTVLSVLNLKYGATPVAQVDPASCTITAAAGAANTATVTIQLKDGSGTNMARIMPFRVYASSAADGLTLASAASTGFSVASGGLSLNNGAAITTQISCMSSATGGCVLSLLDTAKQTSYLVLVLANGCKISAQLSSGSYG
jgi:hypothetical protein